MSEEKSPSPETETNTPSRLSGWEILIVCWGILGIQLLLGRALWRLAPLAIVPIQNNMMNVWHWVAYLSWSGMNMYMEGYRGFQKSFSPMAVIRALHLARNPRPLFVFLAPFFCMGLFAAPRARMIVSWFIVFAVIGLIALIRMLEQPWRGIVDAGVVLGLLWGSLSLFYFFIQALRGKPIPEGRRPSI